MIYEVITRGKDGNPAWVRDCILPGIVPDHVFDLMTVEVVERDLGLCRLCDVQGCRCHVFEVLGDYDDCEVGRKMCPILFHDAVRPRWKVDDIV